MSAHTLSRRGLALAAAAVLTAVCVLSATTRAHASGHAFSFDMVKAQAKALATKPYTPDSSPLPDFFKNMKYPAYYEIKSNLDNLLWRNERLPFALGFFHRGYLFPRKVAINVVQNGKYEEIPFSEDHFDYRKSQYPGGKLPKDMGYAGFVIYHAYEEGGRYKECMVFLGASYFRVKGEDQEYGVSARGLAIDTVEPQGEEFPVFREFWVEKPASDAKKLVIYALMDSQSVTGAYRFVLTPGLRPQVDVQSEVFVRKDIHKLGVAPLTSMYWYGENTGRFPKDPRYVDDFRPEVHDSDGLLMHTGAGEWIFRPLINPKRILGNAFSDNNPRGFGLMQRDHDISHYQDLEALYHIRPSAWVEPGGGWGRGHVELVQIPTDAERYDNIVAYWVSDTPARKGDILHYDYSVTFSHDQIPGVPPAGRAINTFQMRGGMCGSDPCPDAVPGSHMFGIDFSGGILGDLPTKAPVKPDIWVSAGRIIKPVAIPNPYDHGWRVYFEVAPPEGDPRPIEMRVFLKRGDDILTETWSYVWMRD